MLICYFSSITTTNAFINIIVILSALISATVFTDFLLLVPSIIVIVVSKSFILNHLLVGTLELTDLQDLIGYSLRRFPSFKC